MLGLDICADIVLGDDMRRGISGGEKKRVTIGMCPCAPFPLIMSYINCFFQLSGKAFAFNLN